MRMWGVDPELMCRRHLLGEHVEMHMMAGALLRNKKVDGYLDGLFDPWFTEVRHDCLALEMESRGYKHRSPITDLRRVPVPKGRIDCKANLVELARRCVDCRKRIYKELTNAYDKEG